MQLGPVDHRLGERGERVIPEDEGAQLRQPRQRARLHLIQDFVADQGDGLQIPVLGEHVLLDALQIGRAHHLQRF